MLCRSRSIASRHPACFELASLPVPPYPLPLPEPPLEFKSSRAGEAVKAGSLGKPVEWWGTVKLLHTLGSWDTLGSWYTLGTWWALGSRGTLGTRGTLWPRATLGLPGLRRFKALRWRLDIFIGDKVTGSTEGSVVTLGLSIGFLQRGIIWIIMVSTAASIARCGIWNKLPTASMGGEGRGGESVIEGIIATSHACPSMTWAHPPVSAVTRSTQP